MEKMVKTMIAFAFVGFLMTSCGGSEICQCAQAELDYTKEVMAAKDDEKKIEEIQKKYEGKMEKCQELDNGKSKEEEEKMEKEYKECSAYKELQKLEDAK
jgi:hypothetical protein